MTSQIDVSAPASESPPLQVRRAAALWLLAIGAGAFEAVLMLIDAAVNDTLSSGFFGGLAFRVFIFATMTYIVFRMKAGRNWARIAITVLLSVVGLLSLLGEPVAWLLDDNSLSDAIVDASALALIFATSRIVHVLAVLSATAMMYRPQANRYFRSR